MQLFIFLFTLTRYRNIALKIIDASFLGGVAIRDSCAKFTETIFKYDEVKSNIFTASIVRAQCI